MKQKRQSPFHTNICVSILCLACVCWLGNCADWDGLGPKRCNDDSICLKFGLVCRPVAGTNDKVCQTADEPKSEPITEPSEPSEPKVPEAPQETALEPSPEPAEDSGPDEVRVEAFEPPSERKPEEVLETPPTLLVPLPFPAARTNLHSCQTTQQEPQCTCIPTQFDRLLGQAHEAPVQKVAYFQNGTLITGDAHGTLKIWQTNVKAGTDNPFVLAKAHSGSIYDITVYRDWVVTTGGDNAVKLWQFPTGQTWGKGPKATWQFSPAGTQDIPLRVIIGEYAVSKYLVIIGDNKGQLIYRSVDLSTGSFGAQIKKDSTMHGFRNINALVFHPKEKLFVSAGQNKILSNGNIVLWQVGEDASGQPTIKNLQMVTNTIPAEQTLALAIEPSHGDVLLSATDGGALRGWYINKATTAGNPWQLTLLQNPDIQASIGASLAHRIYGIAINAQGDIVSTTTDGRLQWWALQRDPNSTTIPRTPTGATKKQSFQAHTASIQSVSFSPNGTELASGSFDHNVRWWSLLSGTIKENKYFDAYNGSPLGSINSIALSPLENKWIAVGASDGTLRIFSMNDPLSSPDVIWQVLDANNTPLAINSVAFNARGTHLGAVSADGQIGLFKLNNSGKIETKSFTEVYPPDDQRGLTAIAFHPLHPDVFATGDVLGKIKLWQRTSDTTLKELGELAHLAQNGKAEPIQSLAFGPQGHRLSAGGVSGQISLWMWNEQRLIKNLQTPAPQGTAFGLAFWPTSAGHLLSTSGYSVEKGSCGTNNETCALYTWLLPAGTPSRLDLDLSNKGVHETPIRGLAVHPGGKWFASASRSQNNQGIWNKSVRYWLPQQGQPDPSNPLKVTLDTETERPEQQDFARDQLHTAAAGWKHLVLGTSTGMIQRWHCPP